MTTDSGVRAPLPAILRQVEIFRTLGDEEREALASRMERRRFRGGDPVFKEGDPSDGFYIVHSGEVGIFTESAGEKRILARLGPGECFGEMSLLTGEARSTSVYATLDSDLLFLGEAAFETLLRRYPSVALAIGRTLSLRLRRANLAPREESRERIVLCVSLTGWIDACAFGARLAGALSACRGVDVLLLCLGRPPESAPPKRGIEDLRQAVRLGETPDLAAHTAPLGPGVRLLSFAAEEEERASRLLAPLLGFAVAQFGGAVVSAEALRDPSGAPRTAPGASLGEEALRQSDAAILLVDPSEESLSRARSLVARLGAPEAGTAGKVRLALVRRGEIPTGTVQEVEKRVGLDVTYQIDSGDSDREGGGSHDSVAAVARRLSHAGLGLALGGGGARGLAHIGILEVFAAEGIPIDVIGGTSIGSIIAALQAVGHPPEMLKRIVRREWVDRNPLTDFTLPKVALIRGRRGERVLRRVLGETLIEDLPRPYFAVAADLVSAEEVVISRGPLWLAVRASGSIPVLLTPVKVDQRFLVDGGVINNVPGDHLGRFGADIHIAVDVTPRRERYFERLLERPNRSSLLGRLARKSSLLREFLDYPGLIRTLRRVISIEGLEIMKTKSAAFDVCIQPVVDGFDLLDFSKIDRLVEAGREAALLALPAIKQRMAEASARAAKGRA